MQMQVKVTPLLYKELEHFDEFLKRGNSSVG